MSNLDITLSTQNDDRSKDIIGDKSVKDRVISSTQHTPVEEPKSGARQNDYGITGLSPIQPQIDVGFFDQTKKQENLITNTQNTETNNQNTPPPLPNIPYYFGDTGGDSSTQSVQLIRSIVDDALKRISINGVSPQISGSNIDFNITPEKSASEKWFDANKQLHSNESWGSLNTKTTSIEPSFLSFDLRNLNPQQDTQSPQPQQPNTQQPQAQQPQTQQSAEQQPQVQQPPTQQSAEQQPQVQQPQVQQPQVQQPQVQQPQAQQPQAQQPQAQQPQAQQPQAQQPQAQQPQAQQPPTQQSAEQQPQVQLPPAQQSAGQQPQVQQPPTQQSAEQQQPQVQQPPTQQSAEQQPQVQLPQVQLSQIQPPQVQPPQVQPPQTQLPQVQQSPTQQSAEQQPQVQLPQIQPPQVQQPPTQQSAEQQPQVQPPQTQLPQVQQPSTQQPQAQQPQAQQPQTQQPQVQQPNEQNSTPRNEESLGSMSTAQSLRDRVESNKEKKASDDAEWGWNMSGSQSLKDKSSSNREENERNNAEWGWGGPTQTKQSELRDEAKAEAAEFGVDTRGLVSTRQIKKAVDEARAEDDADTESVFGHLGKAISGLIDKLKGDKGDNNPNEKPKTQGSDQGEKERESEKTRAKTVSDHHSSYRDAVNVYPLHITKANGDDPVVVYVVGAGATKIASGVAPEKLTDEYGDEFDLNEYFLCPAPIKFPFKISTNDGKYKISPNSSIINGTNGGPYAIAGLDQERSYSAPFIVAEATVTDLNITTFNITDVNDVDTDEVKIENVGGVQKQTKLRLLIGKITSETIGGKQVLTPWQAITTSFRTTMSITNGVPCLVLEAAPTHQSKI